MTNFTVIQIGYTVYGCGETKSAAIKDAAEWMGVDPTEFVPYHKANHGDCVVIPCSDEFADIFRRFGCDFSWDIDENGAAIVAP